MIVTINKKQEELEDGVTVKELLAKRAVPRASVWINGKQLLRAEYGARVILHGDNVKILRIVAGG